MFGENADRAASAASGDVLPGKYFERYTEQAKDVVFLASQEACNLNHRHVGTEHILLGLVGQRGGAAAVALATLGVTRDGVRDLIVRRVGAGAATRFEARAFTQQALSVLDGAIREALPLGKNYVATEHILLSVVRDNEGHALANLILHDLDVGRSGVYEELKRVLDIDRSGPDRYPKWLA